MKNKDLFMLFEGIKRCSTLEGKAANVVKFHYACSKNKARIESELKHIQGTVANDEKWDKFNIEKDAILQKYATKDDAGTPIKKQLGQFAYEYEYTDEKKAELQLELDPFIEKNADILKARDEKIKQYEELLETESTFYIHTVALENIPDDIKQEQMDLIMEMIESKGDNQ